ncbi:MAG: hypothetical protein OXI96_04470 [Acidimicrobiaceae bacterium]|nr:hypothetical protein [Acidimicrobiaceae bacterium]
MWGSRYVLGGDTDITTAQSESFLELCCRVVSSQSVRACRESDSTAAAPPALSETFAATTTTAISKPEMSSNPKASRPRVFSAASKPPLATPTVAAPPCTLRTSTADPDGSGSRPYETRAIARKRSTIFSQVPSRLQVTR